MAKKPYVVGGVCSAARVLLVLGNPLRAADPEELVKFHRQEQLQRLGRLLSNRLHIGR